jgi:hypothetical protein
MTTHFGRDLAEEGLTDRATRAASMKASLTPRFFMAEHSVAVLESQLCFDLFPLSSTTHQDIARP